MKRRHSVRHFSDKAVPRSVIESCIRAYSEVPQVKSPSRIRPDHMSSPSITAPVASIPSRAATRWL
ncbi:hypothetical protein DWB85_04170 [Seongchinamella sediminis]|uniref:Nitroreductase domain-containing protein n=1 Tax=Seongchinamella sediminis TaxID=2283635 RepID=A0A3L7E2C4_9GAMM|nr:hypothetical protein DWB85_04170 [Seongchinamella sediminis]